MVDALIGEGAPYELAKSVREDHPEWGELLCFQRGPQTLGEYYEEHFNKFLDRDFIVYGDERYTYGQVKQQVYDLAGGLMTKFGVQPGERVAVSMRNFPEWCISFMAATMIGAVAVPLNSLWKESEMMYGLEDSGTKVFIGDEQRCKYAKEACEKLGITAVCVRGKMAGTDNYADVVAAGAGTLSGIGTQPHTDAPALIMYTSGTTGNPKGVVLTHRGVCNQMQMAMLGNAVRSLRQKEEGEQDCAIMPVPLFHVTGCHHIFLSSLITGRKLVLMFKWDALEALKLIERERATSWTGVPTMVQDLMTHPDFDKYDTSSLKSVGGGGAPTPASQVAKADKAFKKARPSQGWGMTETNGGAVVNSGDDYIKNPTSCGKPLPIVQMKTVNVDTGADLGPGEKGELCIKSVLLMKEYWNKPEATAKELDHDGWFHTGDIGQVNEEGFVFILDRAKDLIIRGGENISCAEVEGAFFELEPVMEAAAFGVADERLGEEVGVMVYFKQGMGMSIEELRAGVKGKLAGFKIPLPENLFITPTPLPRGATEKVLKREIRDKINAERAAMKKCRL